MAKTFRMAPESYSPIQVQEYAVFSDKDNKYVPEISLMVLGEYTRLNSAEAAKLATALSDAVTAAEARAVRRTSQMGEDVDGDPFE